MMAEMLAVLHGELYLTERGVRIMIGDGYNAPRQAPIGMLYSLMQLNIRNVRRALPAGPAFRSTFGRYGEPWRAGNSLGVIVTDSPTKYPDTYNDRRNHEYYGGHPVAESMQTSDRDRAIACVNFCEEEAIPSATLTELLDLLEAACTGLYIGPGTPHPELREAAVQLLQGTGRSGGAG